MGRGTAIAIALCAAACSPGAGSRVDGAASETIARNRESVETLRFGMTEAEATAVMGEARMVPPWSNPVGIGPQTVGNPFDAFDVESD